MNYQTKYLKYKKKYLNLSKKMVGGMNYPRPDYPINDSYENVIEPVWKNIISNYINDYVDKNYDYLKNEDINILNNFIDNLISNYEYDKVKNIFEKVNLTVENNDKFKILRDKCIGEIDSLLEILLKNDMLTKFPFTKLDIGRTINKKIFIKEQTIEEFADGKNYFHSIYKLIIGNDTITTNMDKEIRKKFFENFKLGEDEKNII